jgi:hypothetical protein
MSWLELITLVVPGGLGFGGQTYWGTMPFTDYPNAYMGILTLFFAGFGLWVCRGRGMGVFVALFLVSIIVALGSNTFVYELLYRFLPFWKKFRVPVMILVLAHLAGAAMMAMGLTALLGAAGEKPQRREPAAKGDRGAAKGDRAAKGARSAAAGVGVVSLLRTKAIAGVVALVLLLLLAGPLRDWYKDLFVASPRIASYLSAGRLRQQDAFALGDQAARRAHSDLARNVALVTLATAAGVMLVRRRLPAPLFLAGITVLVAVDLVPIGRQVLAPVTQPRAVLERVTRPDDATRFLEAQGPEPFRIFPLEEFTSNRFATFGIASVGGYHAAKPAAYQQLMSAAGIDTRRIFMSEHGLRLLDWLGVRYLVTRQAIPESERFRLAHSGEWRVYENTGASPRAFLVGEAEVLPPGEPTLARLTHPDFDPLATALVDRDPGTLTGPGEVGRVDFLRYDLNGMELEVETAGAALLVLTEGYDPGWRAWVDDGEQEILRVDHAFRGVRIEPGRHRVRFAYVDARLRAGLALSIGAALVIAALIGLGAWRARGLRPAVDA